MNYNRDKVEKILDSIMDNFDFKKVHEVMEFLNWKWAKIDGDGIPTVDDLRDEAARLLWDLVNSNNEVIATGGFYVQKDFSDYDDPWISLKFVLEDWDS